MVSLHIASMAYAAAPPAYPTRLIGCRTEPAVDADGVLFPRGVDDPWHEPVEVRNGLLLWLTPDVRRGRSPAGQGVMAVDGYEPVQLAWTEGILGIAKCTPGVIQLQPASNVLSGVVHSPYRGRRSVEVVGCGGRARASPSGEFHLAVLSLASCEVWATADRATLPSAGVPVAPNQQSGTIVVSATPIGYTWSGIDVRQTWRGVLVARRTGPSLFDVGDLVVALDGRRLRGRDAVDDLGRALAFADSAIPAHRLLVRRDGAKHEAEVRMSFEGAPPTAP